MTKEWQLKIIGVVTVIVSIIFFHFGFFNQLSNLLTDKLFLKHPPDPHIIIVAIDNESLSEIGSWPWSRETFAKALGNIKSAKGIGIDVNFAEPSRLGEADDMKLSKALEDIFGKVVLPIELGSNNKIVTEPLPEFLKVTEQGSVNIPISEDGVAREATIGSGSYSSFDYLLSLKEGPIKEGPNTFRIAYRGGTGTYLTFSFRDVLDGRIPSDVFKDSTVLIGATAPDLHDTLQTPFGILPGVEVHANIIETLRAGHYFKNIPDFLTYLIFILITFGVFYSVRRFKYLSLLSMVSVISVILLYILAAFLFTLYIVIPTVYFLFDSILSLIVAVTFQYLTESKEKRFIRKAFQHYLSVELVDELVRNPHKLVLGGEKREVSILFSDIRSFTTISESMSPEALMLFMGEYFNVASEIILEKRGILDKYIGDAIMAFWGAPLPNLNHSADACRVALSIFQKLSVQNERWSSRGLPFVQIGVGINTGEVIVGNMGSEKRFNYGIVGDEVNLASRLEGLTKYYKVGCIVSERTMKEAEKERDLFFRPLDRVLVKGKKESRRLYELLNKSLLPDLKKHYLEGLDLYEKGEWNKAINSFKAVLKISADGPSEVFLERSESFLENPPENWKGEYTFKAK